MAEPVSLQTLLTYLTLISVPVGVFYHIMTLRNTRKNQQMQLETRQAQLFSQYHLRFHEDYPKYSDILMNWEYEDLDDFTEKYGRAQNPEAYDDWLKLTTFLEGLGVLVKRQLTSTELVSDLMSGFIVRFWEKYKPYTMEMRVKLDWPNAWEHIEYLYDEIEPLYRLKSSN